VNGNDLPNLLSIIAIIATLVVIWFAWQTVKEPARRPPRSRTLSLS